MRGRSPFAPTYVLPARPPVAVLLVACLLWGGLLTDETRAQRAGQTPKQLQNVGVDQRPGATLPEDATFLNEQGERVQLGDYFDGSTPLMLTLNYHRCPQLCQIQLRKFASSVGKMSWTPGDQFEVITVDISPDEGPEMARKAQKRYGGALGKGKAALDGWHFLTGSKDAIDAVTDSVGFRYKRMEDKPQQFAHPTTIVYLSGEGAISRYFTTLDPAPGDIRTALVEASNGTVGNVIDKAFLSCAQFNPDSNSYSASAFKIMRYGSVLIALAMGVALFVFWRREKEKLDEVEERGLDAILDERA